MDQGDVIIPDHTQEVLKDNLNGVDLPVESIIVDQVTTTLLEITEDTLLDHDQTPIQDINSPLVHLPKIQEIEEHILQDQAAEDITMISQGYRIVPDVLGQITCHQHVILHLHHNVTNAIWIFQ